MQKPKSIIDKQNTHAQRFISSKKVNHKTRNEITNSQRKSKVPTNKPSPPLFSRWHKAPKRKRFLSQKHIIDKDQKMSMKSIKRVS
jgi:hypothetical protein